MLTIHKLAAPNPEALSLRPRHAVQHVVLHRILVSQAGAGYPDTLEGVVRFFLEHPEGQAATGSAMPYAVVVDVAGRIFQTLPLDRVAPHARSHNRSSIGLAVIGDFRRHPADRNQANALMQAASSLLRTLELSPKAVVDHDALLGGSADPDKICPGRYLQAVDLRQKLEMHAAQGAASSNAEIKDASWVWDLDTWRQDPNVVSFGDTPIA